MNDPNWFYNKYKPTALENKFKCFVGKEYPEEIFICQERIILSDGKEKYIDFYWPKYQIRIEVDGHEKFKHQYLSDFFNRQNILTLENIKLLRFVWENFREIPYGGRYVVELLNKVISNNVHSELVILPSDPLEKEFKHYRNRQKAEHKKSNIIHFESFFRQHIGDAPENWFSKHARVNVEIFNYNAAYLFLGSSNKIIIDPFPITSMNELDYYLKIQNFLTLAGFKVFKFTNFNRNEEVILSRVMDLLQ